MRSWNLSLLSVQGSVFTRICADRRSFVIKWAITNKQTHSSADLHERTPVHDLSKNFRLARAPRRKQKHHSAQTRTGAVVNKGPCDNAGGNIFPRLSVTSLRVLIRLRFVKQCVVLRELRVIIHTIVSIAARAERILYIGNVGRIVTKTGNGSENFDWTLVQFSA